MAEYIEREAAISAIRQDIMGGLNYKGILNRIPSADVQPVRHGRWVENESKRETHGTITRKYWNCEKCGIEICATLPVFDLNAWHYCPNCGAKMMEFIAEQEDEEDGI